MPRQLVIADATLEAMADVVAGNPRGVILWRDELAAWLANLGRYANGGSDRAHWLEAWAAAGVTINRRSRSQPLHLPHFPVSVIGSIQPDRLADAFAGSDDGMAARFLYAWPDAAQVPLADGAPPGGRRQALAMLQPIAPSPARPSSRRAGVRAEAALLIDGFTERTEGRATPRGWRRAGSARAAARWRGSPASWRCSSGRSRPPGRAAADRPRDGAGRDQPVEQLLPAARPHGVQPGRPHRPRPPRPQGVRWLKACASSR